MRVPLVDLKAQYSTIREEVEARVLEVMQSGRYSLGPAVETFETNFADYCGTDHCIAVNSGTSALHLALLAAGIGKGDEVITSPLTFVATAAAILYAGATPVFADVDPQSYNLDPNQIEERITPRTRAIMPVHLHGQPADLGPIMNIAQQHGIAVIEDAAQAHGAEYLNQRVGSFGQSACFSFYPAKNLGAFGEGGALVTNDPDIAEKARLLRDWGMKEKGVHQIQGFNYRMDSIQGAVLDVKLQHSEDWTQRRREAAGRYDAVFDELGIPRPVSSDSLRHVYHVYAIRMPGRDSLMRALDDSGIGTGIHYRHPVHLQPAYHQYAAGEGEFPVAEALAREFISLPMYPELGPETQDYVIQTLRDAI